MSRHLLIILAVLSPALLVGSARGDDASAPQTLTFEEHVRPILRTACFQCHGEETKHEGDLDVRLKRLIEKGGESGPAIVPGNLEESLLYQRIVSREMPPGESKLSEKDVKTIAAWITGGAKTAHPEPEQVTPETYTFAEKNFWSFRPIRRPEVPTVRHADRVRTPIDAFLLSRLEAENLALAPDADRATLIRRVSFDLLGLPPTPLQVRDFLADESPQAYEQLVDRLLASDHYGERWGRHWLDVAGYADSEGYNDADIVRDSAYRYRDYVIASLNADKPFDQFIQEQLAGDELVGEPLKNLRAEQVEKLTATGFLRMAPDGTGSNESDPNLARNQVLAGTINIVTTSLMGLTVGCAQCHDHRYDPISQADYYRLRAIFEPAYNPQQWRPPAARQISLYTDEDRQLAAMIEAEAIQVDAEREQTIKQFIDQTLTRQLLKVPKALREPLSEAYKTPPDKRSAEKIALLDQYPKILTISAGSLYLYDREIQEDAAKIDEERLVKEKQFVEQTFATQLATLPAEVAEAVRSAHATTAATRTAEQNALLARHADLLVTAETLPRFAPEAAEQLETLKKAADDLRASQTTEPLKKLAEKAAAIRAKKPIEGFVRALTEVPGEVPETFLFYRGDHEQPKQQLAPAGLSVLADQNLGEIPENDPSLPTTGRRLAFARRLTSGAHPLTARVLVNRVWLHHFGRGIVETPGDFGYLGARPTHPELLDWLATQFMADGWRLKRLHKLIVTSTAYRQSSQRSAELDAIDPDNRLVGRMSIRRLEAETIRDAILAVTGKLNERMFGEPVPVMEDGVGQIVLGKENLDGERKPGTAISLGDDEFRRSIYVQVRRTLPLAVLETFDAPAMEPNCTVRSSSTVATQSLMFMNGEFAAAYAQHFARHVQTAVGDEPATQVQLAWLLAFGREPTAQQVSDSARYLAEQNLHFEQNPPPGEKISSQLLALASYCQALISSNGFLYVD